MNTNKNNEIKDLLIGKKRNPENSLSEEDLKEEKEDKEDIDNSKNNLANIKKKTIYRK